jgi:hypothetical protein
MHIKAMKSLAIILLVGAMLDAQSNSTELRDIAERAYIGGFAPIANRAIAARAI